MNTNTHMHTHKHSLTYTHTHTHQCAHFPMYILNNPLLFTGRLPGAQYAYDLLVKSGISLTELGYMPDFVLRAGIRQLLGMRAGEVRCG